MSDWVPTIKEMVGYGYSNYHTMKMAHNAADNVVGYARRNGISVDDILGAYAHTSFDSDVRSIAASRLR